MASLSDISAHAGVSLATASRVLSGSDHPVAAKTRERVLVAAQELGYSPSELARALVNRSSRIIGIIVGDIVDPYYAEIAHGVEDVAARSGYLTTLCSTQRSSVTELAHLDVLRDYQAAGVIFAYSSWINDERADELASAVADLQASGCTVVALGERTFECLTVRVDNHAVAYDITDYLISLGHRRIAFIEGPLGTITSAKRLGGFKAAMTGAGLSPDLTLEGGFEFETGYNAALRLLAAGDPPDAILAANDEGALGVLSALRQAGVQVPQDISVAGIDDTRPTRAAELTTVRTPMFEMGAVAARAILEDGQERPDYVLPHRIHPRSTTARRTATKR